MNGRMVPQYEYDYYAWQTKVSGTVACAYAKKSTRQNGPLHVNFVMPVKYLRKAKTRIDHKLLSGCFFFVKDAPSFLGMNYGWQAKI